MSFLNRFNLLGLNQYRFRKICFTYICDKITGSIDNRNFGMEVLIDQSKAFYTIDYEITINKLEFYRI